MATASRRGLGKVRHIETHELWIQDAVDRKRLEIHKIKNKYNPADALTKNLTREEMDLIVDRLGHAYEQGRSDAAPELSSVELMPMMIFTLQNLAIKNYWI